MIAGKWKTRITLSAVVVVLAASLSAYVLLTSASLSAAFSARPSAVRASAIAWASTLSLQTRTAAAAAAPVKPKAEVCLACHGPFEKLKARTAGYTSPEGEKLNPHLNVPHKSTNVTTCTECHEVHPLPVTGQVKIAKATVQYCYAACHHTNDFTPCVQCHKDMK
jgi:hypothetical protein